MRSEILEMAASLARNGDPFVVAVVVRREPASSAQVGNMALVTAQGEFRGWLGGSCIRPTIVHEALAALEDGSPRLVSLSPTPQADRRPGVTVYPMTCHSGGTVDIYVEPVLPAPHLLVFGVTPAAQALVRLGKAMGFTVDAVDPEADAAAFPEADRVLVDTAPATITGRTASNGRSRLYAVVATHGQRDEDAVAEAIAVESAYIGVVASRKRFEQIRATLVARGIPGAALDRVRSPAGLDIGAKAPEEVALSILGEIVQLRRTLKGRKVATELDALTPAAEREPAPKEAAPDAAAHAIDPVCGMTVEVAPARHKAEHGGRTYYFCCAGCRQRFLAAPEQYGAATPA
jgi:xanthine dehydrogenase accessory factor